MEYLKYVQFKERDLYGWVILWGFIKVVEGKTRSGLSANNILAIAVFPTSEPTVTVILQFPFDFASTHGIFRTPTSFWII